MSTLLHFGTDFSFEKSLHILKTIAKGLNPSQHLADLVEENKWAELLTFEIDYTSYSTAYDVWRDRQVLALFQKNESLELGVDRRASAMEKFLAAEASCKSMNASLKIRAPGISERFSGASLRFEVARKIATILGEAPVLDELSFGFGPGANVGLSRLTSIRRKIAACPTLTSNAWRYLQYFQETCPHWATLANAKVVPAGRVTFVPKTALTFRSICVEPIVNTYAQKGLGTAIRERLRRHGCNLNTQKRNQQLAREGAMTGKYATIDLSSASDTISYGIVKDLLPEDWFDMLDACRTPVVEYQGDLITLEKFSSMGNGYTFELESLIFFATALVVTESRDVSVYGDDIIVPCTKFDKVSSALVELGFEVNTKKSFNSGPFRESCGGDYFGRVNVRPCYVKGRMSIKELFRLHNYFIRKDEVDLALSLLQYIPHRFRLYGPDGYGDGHLLGDHPKLIHKKNRGFAGYVFRTFTTKPFRKTEPLPGDYAAFLYNCTSKCVGTSEVDRDFDEGDLSRHDRILRPWLVCATAEYTPTIASEPASDSLYQERVQSKARYRISRIYTMG